jgi:hypothetical protein
LFRQRFRTFAFPLFLLQSLLLSSYACQYFFLVSPTHLPPPIQGRLRRLANRRDHSTAHRRPTRRHTTLRQCYGLDTRKEGATGYRGTEGEATGELGQGREGSGEQGDLGSVLAGSFTPLSVSFSSSNSADGTYLPQPNHDEVIAANGETFGDFTTRVFKRTFFSAPFLGRPDLRPSSYRPLRRCREVIDL